MPEGGNPNITEHSKGHRFGDEGHTDPREAQKKASKPWSIRNGVRRIAGSEFDVGPDAPPFGDQLNQVFGGTSRMTGAQIAAVKKFSQAMNDVKAMENLTNDIDGKLIERKVEAKPHWKI